jgi:hypothetical protein
MTDDDLLRLRAEARRLVREEASLPITSLAEFEKRAAAKLYELLQEEGREGDRE